MFSRCLQRGGLGGGRSRLAAGSSGGVALPCAAAAELPRDSHRPFPTCRNPPVLNCLSKVQIKVIKTAVNRKLISDLPALGLLGFTSHRWEQEPRRAGWHGTAGEAGPRPPPGQAAGSGHPPPKQRREGKFGDLMLRVAAFLTADSPKAVPAALCLQSDGAEHSPSGARGHKICPARGWAQSLAGCHPQRRAAPCAVRCSPKDLPSRLSTRRNVLSHVLHCSQRVA